MLVRMITTAMICGLLMVWFEPATLLYYFGGWFLMVIAMREGAHG